MEASTVLAAEPVSEALMDGRRALELYKYFLPPGTALSTARQPREPRDRNIADTVLTAHAQLVSWRLNCSRAMVSLIDRDMQYFVAEATKTVHLDDNSLCDDPSDAIWAGCISVPKAGRLCEHTISQLPREDGDPAYFEVCDLPKDDRFNTLPFVTAEPYFKYYCGVPLKTKNGTAIGSLFALDDKVREPITLATRLFLATMAENVMRHYESMKEKEERKRVLSQNMCLAAFVDPANRIVRPTSRHDSRPVGEDRRASGASPLNAKAPGLHKASYESLTSTASGLPTDDEDTANTAGTKNAPEVDNIETFKRAAHLLHSALALDNGGGVVFLDTAASYRTEHKEKYDVDKESEDLESDLDDSSPQMRTRRSWGPPNRADPPEKQNNAKAADVLADTITPIPVENGAGRITRFVPLCHEDLAKLIRRHPRGKFFDINPSGGVYGSSSEGEDSVYDVPKSARMTGSPSECLLLAKHFPGARQVIFLPLWDATASRFTTLFAYNSSDYRSFSSANEFLYCIAFGNCITTEISRIATQAADQQKSDFIGSISHELRSPLHGILASCEFLADTDDLTTFQRSLVDTADSCARTLLDTISMVLDYSKINAFERNASKAGLKKGEIGRPLAAAGGAQLNIFGNVDLAAITEEVVEGVAAGQVFKHSLTGADATDMSADAGQYGFSGRKEVEIILDIAPQADPKNWTFVTQPGAFRRIIMNIFGNALKYTRKGYIKVRLEVRRPRRNTADSAQDEQGSTSIRLTITDTGQGISSQFMRNKLYTPFAQENSIAPGTGLGLSLVKSMVTMLNGEISIESSLGIGTRVTVTFPMSLSPESSSTESGHSGSTPSSTGSIERAKDESVLIVRKKAIGRRATIFPAKTTANMSEAQNLERETIERYMSGWFGFEMVESISSEVVSGLDLIIVDEEDLPALETYISKNMGGHGPMIIVMCMTQSVRASHRPSSTRLELVSRPFGPFKLAKIVRMCLDRLEQSLVTEDVHAENQAAAAAGKGEAQGPSPVIEDVVQSVEQLTLQSIDPSLPNLNLIRSGGVTANEDSIHAQLVVHTPADVSTITNRVDEEKEYPFPPKPNDENDGTISPSNLGPNNGDRPDLLTRRTVSPPRAELRKQAIDVAQPISSKGALTSASPSLSAPLTPLKRSPRLLLVDDNKVNLRLLQTFMKKRAYTDVHSAEDGAQAVATYRSLISSPRSPRGPDIVFMDISMPVMNGFQATREIRAIEEAWRNGFVDPMERPGSALIIALTGLASGRDQSEAFTSGFDLFLTKPTSFREVGRLLDNWERSGSAAAPGVPNGPVTGEE